MKRIIDGILTEIGGDVSIHFTAFHPDFQMRDIPATPHEILQLAYETAMQAGLNYVYLGNMHDVTRQSTYCPKCQKPLIQRNWHQITDCNLDLNRCHHCDTLIPGRFEMEAARWGRQRQPVTVKPSHSETQSQ